MVTHKRVYRLYREQGLAMRHRKRKRWRAEARVPLVLPKPELRYRARERTGARISVGRRGNGMECRHGCGSEQVLAAVA